MSESANYTSNPPINSQTQPQLSKSDIFGILQNDRRRHVLELLHDKGNQSVRSLSEEIARIESGTEEPKSSVRKSVYVSLLQTHIPKMESLGVIKYNKEQDSVELLPAAHTFDIYMETVEKGDIPWNQFYLGLSILALAGGFFIREDLIDFISSTQWTLFISSIFFASALAHTRYVKKI